MQKKTVSGSLAQRTRAHWSPEKVKVLKMSHERLTLGAHVPPTLTDGDELFTALTSTSGRLTTLKEWPF